MAEKMKENLKKTGIPVSFATPFNPTTDCTTKNDDNSNESEDSESMKCKQLFQKCIHYTSL